MSNALLLIARRAVPFLLTLPVLACASSKDGFFTGPRAETIAMLRQANAQGTPPDQALSLALRARRFNEGRNDPFMDAMIDLSLSTIYRHVGDVESASVHYAQYTETLLSTLRDEGTQGWYTLYLIQFDLGTQSFGSNDEETVRSFAELDTNVQELATMAEELNLSEAYKELLRSATDDMVTGTAQLDAQKMKRGRRAMIRVFDEMYRLSVIERGKDAEAPAVYALFREFITSQFDAGIAMVERDRRGFQRSLRKWLTCLNKIAERGGVLDQ